MVRKRLFWDIDADQFGQVRTHGWTAGSSVMAVSLAIQMRQLGVTQAIHTSIHQDGSMTGVDLNASVEIAQLSGLSVTVGGGVGGQDDILDCYNQEGISGVIIGKALYTGAVDLAAALKSAGQKNRFESRLVNWKEEQETPWSKFSYEQINENLKAHFPVDSKPLRILDAGGGNGLDSLPLARLNHNIDIVDVSSEMLADANSNAALSGVSGRVTTHAIDLLKIGKRFEANSFDAVLCHNVIQFVDDLAPLFRAIATVLRSGGFMSLIATNQHSLPLQSAFLGNDLDQALAAIDQDTEYNAVFDMDVRVFKPQDLVNSLGDFDFSLEKHYGVRCLYNYWGSNETKNDPDVNHQLKSLEVALSDLEPYKHTARLFQLILRKN